MRKTAPINGAVFRSLFILQSITKRAFHAANSCCEGSTTCQRRLYGLRLWNPMLQATEVGHQKRSDQRISRPHGVNHTLNFYCRLNVKLPAIIEDASVCAARCAHQMWPKAADPFQPRLNVLLCRIHRTECIIHIRRNPLIIGIVRIIGEIEGYRDTPPHRSCEARIR